MRVHFFVKLFFSWIFLKFPNCSIMFFDVRRKIVRPVILGDEIKVRDGSWVDRSQEGVLTRVTDGSGRKSSIEVSVIRSGSHQMFFG